MRGTLTIQPNDNDVLYIMGTFMGQRVRESTHLKDTPQNLIKAN